MIIQLMLILSPYTFQEMKLMCESLPRGKAPGKDNVSYEHFKYAGTHFIEALTILFNGIFGTCIYSPSI